MEFEEIKKIWDKQNREPLYAIDENALHNRIRSKRIGANRLNNLNDFGLIFVAVVTAVILLIIRGETMSDFIISGVLLLIAGYVFISRVGRIKKDQKFDRSMLGELNHALSCIDYEIHRASTFIWWFLIPIAIPITINFMVTGASYLQWLIVAVGYLLAISITQWEMRVRLNPKRRNLETLRLKILNEHSDET